MIEGFTSPGVEIEAAIGFNGDGAIAIKLNLVNPFRAVRQLRDRGAIHRFDEFGLAFWKRSESSDSGLLLHPSSQTASDHFISHTSYVLHCTPCKTELSFDFEDEELMDEARIVDLFMVTAFALGLLLTGQFVEEDRQRI